MMVLAQEICTDEETMILQSINKFYSIFVFLSFFILLCYIMVWVTIDRFLNEIFVKARLGPLCGIGRNITLSSLGYAAPHKISDQGVRRLVRRVTQSRGQLGKHSWKIRRQQQVQLSQRKQQAMHHSIVKPSMHTHTGRLQYWRKGMLKLIWSLIHSIELLGECSLVRQDKNGTFWQ